MTRSAARCGREHAWVRSGLLLTEYWLSGPGLLSQRGGAIELQAARARCPASSSRSRSSCQA